MQQTDILIIGGGIAGSSTAYHLAMRGHDVTLLERGELASEASGLNAGTTWASGWGKTPNLASTLSMGGLDLFQTVQFDPGYDIEVNRQHAIELFPFLRDYPVKRAWAGWMPFTRHLKLIIGSIPQRENLYVLAGLSSSGFEQGPMAGKLLADYIHDGSMPGLLSEADPAQQVTPL